MPGIVGGKLRLKGVDNKLAFSAGSIAASSITASTTCLTLRARELLSGRRRKRRRTKARLSKQQSIRLV
jgi:hypothetical protein